MSEASVDYNSIVSDNGSGYCKLGYGGDSFPRFVIPSIIGRPMLRASQKVGDQELKEIMIGDEAAPLRNYLEIKYPLKEGKIGDWDDMEILWEYCFENKLGLGKDKSDKRVLLTEPALNPMKNREKMGEYMFEKFNFGGVMFEYQALLTLMAEGNRTGAVLDSGDGVSHIIPVYEGLIQSENIRKMNIAGRHVTEYLIKLMMHRGYAFNGSADYEQCREIKEDLCYATINPKKESKMAQETTVLDKEYVLPNGDTIIIGRERFMAPEILMKPELIDCEDDGIPDMIFKSIANCPIDMKKELAANIWLSGGTTMIPGLSSRIEHDVKELYVKLFKGNREQLKKFPVVVHDPPSRKNAVFMGASFFGKIAQPEQYISKAEYQENGSKVFFRRA